jgi:hypothetical protein
MRTGDQDGQRLRPPPERPLVDSRLRPPPPRPEQERELRDAAWDKLTERWGDVGNWKKLHLSENDLRNQVNDGIRNSHRAGEFDTEQKWKDFKEDLIKVGLLRPEEPMRRVKVKTMEPPVRTR